MAGYTVSVGTGDPHPLHAGSQADAITQAVGHIESRYAQDLRQSPQVVVTLLGPDGLVTRPSERLDEFVRRQPGPHPILDTDSLQPGDTNTPDCNGD